MAHQPLRSRSQTHFVLCLGPRCTLDAAEAAELHAVQRLGRPRSAQGTEHLGAAPGVRSACATSSVHLARASDHLASPQVLGEAGLVQGDRRGKWVWYSLNRERLSQLQSTIDA